MRQAATARACDEAARPRRASAASTSASASGVKRPAGTSAPGCAGERVEQALDLEAIRGDRARRQPAGALEVAQEVGEDGAHAGLRPQAEAASPSASSGCSSWPHFWHLKYVPFFFDCFSERNGNPHAGHGRPMAGRSHVAYSHSG